MAYDQEEMKQRATTGGKGNTKVQIYEHLGKRHSLSPGPLMGVNPNFKRLLRHLDDPKIDGLILKE